MVMTRNINSNKLNNIFIYWNCKNTSMNDYLVLVHPKIMVGYCLGLKAQCLNHSMEDRFDQNYCFYMTFAFLKIQSGLQIEFIHSTFSILKLKTSFSNHILILFLLEYLARSQLKFGNRVDFSDLYSSDMSFGVLNLWSLQFRARNMSVAKVISF